MTVLCSRTAVRLAFSPKMTVMYYLMRTIFDANISSTEAELLEGFEVVGASVKVPGEEVKFPCGACEARCVEQQVTLHSFWVYTIFNIFLTFNTVDFKCIKLFKMEVGELQSTNFFLFVECISGYSSL